MSTQTESKPQGGLISGKCGIECLLLPLLGFPRLCSTRQSPFLTQSLFLGSDQSKIIPPASDETEKPDETLAVRFASVNQEIQPAMVNSLDAEAPASNITGNEDQILKEAAEKLHKPILQERRMSCFAFEPVSLPASRVRLPFHSVLRDSPPTKSDDWQGPNVLLSPSHDIIIPGLVDEICGNFQALPAFHEFYALGVCF